MYRKIEVLLTLAFSLLLTNAATAQSITINGRPLVTNPRQQITPTQANRVFGGLNVAAHTVPPAGQPAFLVGNPAAVQQMNAALQANGNYNVLYPPALPQPLPIAAPNAPDGANPLAPQGYLAAANAPNVPLRPLTPAEYNRLFGGLSQAAPVRPSSETPAATQVYPPPR
jgi:hypothetical protein